METGRRFNRRNLRTDKRISQGRSLWTDEPNSASRLFGARQYRGRFSETIRDYLHFLYIARGSLTEVQYFIHLAHRIAYLPDKQNQVLSEQIKATFARLHGLIKAVEKESRR